MSQVWGMVQKVTFLGNTDNVNFGWFAYDSTDGHPKKPDFEPGRQSAPDYPEDQRTDW